MPLPSFRISIGSKTYTGLRKSEKKKRKTGGMWKGKGEAFKMTTCNQLHDNITRMLIQEACSFTEQEIVIMFVLIVSCQERLIRILAPGI